VAGRRPTFRSGDCEQKLLDFGGAAGPHRASWKARLAARPYP